MFNVNATSTPSKGRFDATSRVFSDIAIVWLVMPQYDLRRVELKSMPRSDTVHSSLSACANAMVGIKMAFRPNQIDTPTRPDCDDWLKSMETFHNLLPNLTPEQRLQSIQVLVAKGEAICERLSLVPSKLTQLGDYQNLLKAGLTHLSRQIEFSPAEI